MKKVVLVFNGAEAGMTGPGRLCGNMRCRSPREPPLTACGVGAGDGHPVYEFPICARCLKCLETTPPGRLLLQLLNAPF